MECHRSVSGLDNELGLSGLTNSSLIGFDVSCAIPGHIGSVSTKNYFLINFLKEFFKSLLEY